MTVKDYGVITMETTFQEASEKFDVAARNAGRVIWQHFDWIAHAAEDVGVPILMEFTPVRTGAGRASTEAHVWADEGQVRVSFEQPAVNSRGEEYLPAFVIPGTKYMAPNPYNRSAFQEMQDPMNDIILKAGRQIADDLVGLLHMT